MIMADGLSVADIRARLSAAVVGRHLYRLGEVESTSAVACRLARDGAAEGTVVLADAETAGPASLGRPCGAPGGVNLHVSVLFRPGCHAREADHFSLIGPLALCDALEDLGLSPAVEWPNEVLVGGRKVARAQAEFATRGEEITYLVVGITVNVNAGPVAGRAAMPAAGATSLRAALGRPIGRSALAASYLSRLDAWARRYDEDGPERILAAWCDRDILAGRCGEPRAVEDRAAAGADPLRDPGLEASGGWPQRGGGEKPRISEQPDPAGQRCRVSSSPGRQREERRA